MKRSARQTLLTSTLLLRYLLSYLSFYYFQYSLNLLICFFFHSYSFFRVCFSSLFVHNAVLSSTVLLMPIYTWHCIADSSAQRTMEINFKTTKTFITKLFIYFFPLGRFGFRSTTHSLRCHSENEKKNIHTHTPAKIRMLLNCVCFIFISLRGSYNEIICLKTYLHISTILNVIIFFCECVCVSRKANQSVWVKNLAS